VIQDHAASLLVSRGTRHAHRHAYDQRYYKRKLSDVHRSVTEIDRGREFAGSAATRTTAKRSNA